MTFLSRLSATARARRVVAAAATATLALAGLAVVDTAPAGAGLDPIPGYLYAFAGSGVQGAPTPGPAVDSALALPVGLAVDSAGNTFISDAYGNRIEKVTPAGTLSIVAGNGVADLPTPGPAASSNIGTTIGIAVDSSDNLYAADARSHEILKITPSGTLSIFAGTGIAGTPTPGPATDSMLAVPVGIAVDSLNNVYVSELSDQIVKITPSGTLSIFAGTGTGGVPTPGPAIDSSFDGPFGLAVDSSNNLYVADSGNSEIEKITPSGTLSIFAGSGAGDLPTPGPAVDSALALPVGLAVDSSNNVYVADAGASMVEKITPAGTLSIIAGNGTTGHPTLGGPATSSALSGPYTVGVDARGGILVADSFNGTVERIAPKPPAPILVKVTATKRSAVTVSWRPPTSGAGKITAYAAVARDDTGAIVGACYGSRSNRHCSIGGLTSGQTYAFSVFAAERVGIASRGHARGHITVTSNESAPIDAVVR